MSRLVLILGMHRSGSSALTAGLPCLGAALAHDLLGPAPDNPRGFYESIALINLDDEILRRAGSAWDDPRPIEPVWLRRLADQDLGIAARLYLSGYVHRYPIFAMKEPRLCRLLPFWKPIFEALDLQVSCVIVGRSASAIAKSLHKRNGMSLATAHLLISEYEMELATTEDVRWPRCHVEYENLIRDPVAALRFIGASLNLTLDEKAAHRYAMTFIDANLDHSR